MIFTNLTLFCNSFGYLATLKYDKANPPPNPLRKGGGLKAKLTIVKTPLNIIKTLFPLKIQIVKCNPHIVC